MMRKRTVPCILVVAICCLVATLGTATAQPQSPKPLTNADVVKMVRSGLGESVILAAIRANSNNFDISANALIALQKAGVNSKIMNAMITAATNQQNAAPSALAPSPAPAQAPGTPPSGAAPDATPSQNPFAAATGGPSSVPPGAAATAPSPVSVTLVQGATRQDILVEKTVLAETKTKPTSMASLASDSALGQGLQAGLNTVMAEATSHTTSTAANTGLTQMGSIFSNMLSKRKPDVTYVWAVPNPASTNVLSSTVLSFEVKFAGIPGVNPDEFEPEIVLLTPTPTNFRLVGATRGKADATASSTVDWQVYTGFLEDRAPAQAQKLAAGHYKISSTSALAPGEYAVVLRPISKNKKFSGGEVARGQGNGLMFDSVFSFEIAAGAKP